MNEMTKKITRIMWYQKVIDFLLKRQTRLHDELYGTINYGWATTGDIVDDFLIKRNRKYSADLSDQYRDLRDRLRDHCGELLLIVEREYYEDAMTKMRDMRHHCTVYSLAAINGTFEFHQGSREKLFFAIEDDLYAHAYVYGNDHEVNRWSIASLACPDLEQICELLIVDDLSNVRIQKTYGADVPLAKLEIVVGTVEVQKYMAKVGSHIYTDLYHVLGKNHIYVRGGESVLLQFPVQAQK